MHTSEFPKGDGWIFVDDKMPPEDEYILAKSGENSPIFITRLHNGDWEITGKHKNPCFTKKEKFYTSASVVYWMPLPEVANE